MYTKLLSDWPAVGRVCSAPVSFHPAVQLGAVYPLLRMLLNHDDLPEHRA